MVASHSISFISIAFGLCLFVFSVIAIMDFQDKHKKCHFHHEKFRPSPSRRTDRARHQHRAADHHHHDHTPCNGDAVLFGSCGLFVITAVVQCLGAIPAWYKYWKVWALFQVFLLLSSAGAIALPFILEGLDRFGGPEDVKIVALSSFGAIEFLFALLSLSVMFYLQFE